MIIEESEVTVKEISKSQNIRLVDVFIIAPILIYAGTIKPVPVWLKLSLIVIGIATAFYNGKNYLKNI
jgi:hypothetical protein